MKKNKVRSIIIVIVLFVIILFLAYEIFEKVFGQKSIHTDVPDSLKRNEEYINNIVLEGDNKVIGENEYVTKENSSLYSYTNETQNSTTQENESKDENFQKAIKLAKKYWGGSEDDKSALYTIMDHKDDKYYITLYDTVTTHAFLWLEVNVKDGTVVEAPAQYTGQ